MSHAAAAAPPFLDTPSVSAALESRLVPLTVAIESSLIAYSAGRVSQPLRSVVPIDAYGGAMLTMPAYLPPDFDNAGSGQSGADDERPSLGVLGHKTVTVFPRNATMSPPLASHHAIVTLMRPDTGQARYSLLLLSHLSACSAHIVPSRVCASGACDS